MPKGLGLRGERTDERNSQRLYNSARFAINFLSSEQVADGEQMNPSIVAHFSAAVGGDDPAARLSAALACAATQSGHVCADLDMDTGWGAWAAQFDSSARAALRDRLPALDIVGGEDDWTPLVWDGHRLYLRRYRDYERRVADHLRRSAQRVVPLDATTLERLDALFPDPGQRLAAHVALARDLCLVSGGPGTGKTHTLARIIGLLRERDPKAMIGLAAPTGKAAARMADALASAGVDLPTRGAMTLHRLLGIRPDGSARHGRDHPLALATLVVDEASMIDLALMARLLDALRPQTRLVLVGDCDQLAAVEAGAVFADLCASPALAASVARLATSFRFGGMIGQLAAALREGNADAALDLLRMADADPDSDLKWLQGGKLQTLVDTAREGYASFHAAVDKAAPPAELFDLFASFRVLCAHRHEVFAINRALARGENIIPGMPVMLTHNDPLLRLFNGDVGLTLRDPADGALKACFSDASGFRWIALARLPAWEPAWAMTVHKSQGSEFARVLLALPDEASPVLTRELVYTGVTRARKGIILQASESTLRTALARRSERMSGLRDALK